MSMSAFLRPFAASCFCLALVSNPLLGQPFLEESFDYPAGTALSDHSWTQIRGGTPIAVSTGGLGFPGFSGFGIGNAAELVSGNGQEVVRAFAAQNVGSVYLSFLLELETVSLITNNGLLLYLGPTGTTIFNRGLSVWVNEDGSGNVRFGVSKAGGINFSTSDYSLGTTYLVVVKYEFIAGDDNDRVSLWVDPDPTQPEPLPDATTASGLDRTEIAEIALTQIDAETPTATVDEIRVAATWAAAGPLLFEDGFESGDTTAWTRVEDG